MKGSNDTSVTPLTGEASKRMTILLAEDEEFNRLYISELLAKTKYELIEATNGEEAVAMVKKKENIDVVLMDINMPRLNGREAMKQIKALHPEIPVIALTAFGMDSDRRDALDSGFDSYLSKPIDKDALFDKIKYYSKT